MTTFDESLPATAQLRRQPSRATNSNARNSRPQKTRSINSAGSSRSPATNPQNARRNYERYLTLARNESDRIVAENYLQHAEHYFRSMQEPMTT